MLPWCGPLDLAGWLITAATWSAIVGLGVWAVLLLFPSRRSLKPRSRREFDGPRESAAPASRVTRPAPPPEA